MLTEQKKALFIQLRFLLASSVIRILFLDVVVPRQLKFDQGELSSGPGLVSLKACIWADAVPCTGTCGNPRAFVCMLRATCEISSIRTIAQPHTGRTWDVLNRRHTKIFIS